MTILMYNDERSSGAWRRSITGSETRAGTLHVWTAFPRRPSLP